MSDIAAADQGAVGTDVVGVDGAGERGAGGSPPGCRPPRTGSQGNVGPELLILHHSEGVDQKVGRTVVPHAVQSGEVNPPCTGCAVHSLVILKPIEIGRAHV